MSRTVQGTGCYSLSQWPPVTAGKHIWIMHCAVAITACLFKCTSCPMYSGHSSFAAPQLCANHMKRERNRHPASVKRSYLCGNTWNTGFSDSCPRSRQKPAGKLQVGYENVGFLSLFYFFTSCMKHSSKKALVSLAQACTIICRDASTNEICSRWPHWQIHSRSQDKNFTSSLSHHLCSVSLIHWRLWERFHLMLHLLGKYLPLKINNKNPEKLAHNQSDN